LLHKSKINNELQTQLEQLYTYAQFNSEFWTFLQGHAHLQALRQFIDFYVQPLSHIPLTWALASHLALLLFSLRNQDWDFCLFTVSKVFLT